MRIKKIALLELADQTDEPPAAPLVLAAGTERLQTIRTALENGEFEIDVELLTARLLRTGGR